MNNKMKWKRYAAAMLCTAVLLGTVSCGDKDKNDTVADGSGSAEVQTLTPEEYEAYSFDDVKSAFPDIPYVYAFDRGDGSADDTVTYDEYRYYQLLYKNYFDGGDDTYWTTNPDMKDRITQMYNTEIRRNHTVFSECETYGLLLTADEAKSLDRQNAEFVAAFGDSDYFRQALDQYYMTEYYFRYQSELELLYPRLESYYRENGQILTAEADIRAVLDTDAFVRCKHILIKNDIGENPADNRALAEQLLDRIHAGEDFDTLMTEYTEDPGIQSEPGGYYFFRGEMDTAFENASFALADGELSDIVESSYGYHIILRCEKDPAYLDANLKTISQTYSALRFYQVLDEVSAGWTVAPSEQYEILSDWNYAVSLGTLYTEQS